MGQDPFNESGDYLEIVPITGIKLTDAVNNRFKISRVEFITKEKLFRIRNLGLNTTISKLYNKDPYLIKKYFDTYDTFALVKFKGVPTDHKKQLDSLIREELDLLSSSQLGWNTREDKNRLDIDTTGSSAIKESLTLNTKTLNFTVHGKRTVNPLPLKLSSKWLKVQKSFYFLKLLKIINGEVKVTNSWKKTLKRAAIMIGQSQNSRDIAFSFLWNMIAIEMLLTRQGDKYTEVLPKRIESFLGWVGYWNDENFEEKISSAYKKRNAFVHDGNKDKITELDLQFTDDIVLNLLTNIISHINIFNSKEDILKYSDKFQAEKTLGIKSKIQPKTLKFSRVRKEDIDLNEYFA